tara:strand:+ start:127 stop:1341 length:1215 start_codon:yes stop_codon:yes gene_type:complete
MIEIIKNRKLIKIISSSFLLILGLFISSHKGYGDDIDSRALISTFINMIENGVYAPSRYYGHPFAELVLGFMGYFFGSFVSSFFSYIFFILSLILIYFSFSKKKINISLFALFLLLCISNPVLFLDNTNPSDAPLALFLFSAGIFLLNKKINILSAVFFGLCIASRANYALFVYFTLFFYLFKNDLNNYNFLNKERLFYILIFSTLIGGLFYFPIFIQSFLSLDFIRNAGGPELTLATLLPRFVYKIYLSIGFFSAPLFFLLLCFVKKNLLFKTLNDKTNQFFLGLIILNLLLFFLIPTKTSIISLSIVLIYLLFIKIVKNKNFIYLVIFFNLLFYIFSYQIFEIKYNSKKPCDPIQAIGANYKPKFLEGYFITRSKKLSEKIVCDSKFFGDRKDKYQNGKKLK